jgi:hypothetical protein
MGKTTHGHTRTYGSTRIYQTWKSMRSRCHNPNDPSFAYYGAKGIVVCDRWRESFENFVADMGERPLGHTLDRYPDNGGNYEPSNCRWATRRTQTLNTSRTKWITFNGETLCMKDWAERVGLLQETLWTRLNRGWPIEKALSTPPHTTKPTNNPGRP